MMYHYCSYYYYYYYLIQLLYQVYPNVDDILGVTFMRWMENTLRDLELQDVLDLNHRHQLNRKNGYTEVQILKQDFCYIEKHFSSFVLIYAQNCRINDCMYITLGKEILVLDKCCELFQSIVSNQSLIIGLNISAISIDIIMSYHAKKLGCNCFRSCLIEPGIRSLLSRI